MSKSNGAVPHGRKLYDMIDVLKQAKGLPTTDGYAVLTKGFVDDLCAELKRLYEVEDESRNLSRNLLAIVEVATTAVRILAEQPRSALNDRTWIYVEQLAQVCGQGHLFASAPSQPVPMED